MTVSKKISNLSAIHHYLNSMLADDEYSPSQATMTHINALLHLSKPSKKKVLPKLDSSVSEESNLTDIIISCDASVKENGVGPSSCGIVVNYKHVFKLGPRAWAKILPKSKTNNQAEYDAVYEAFRFLQDFAQPESARYVKIYTDSKLVVEQLYERFQTHDSILNKKRLEISSLWSKLHKTNGKNLRVSILWAPRNSTEELKKANNLAQDVLGVPRH